MDSNFKEKLVRCYKEYLGDYLISIVLFGSRARGGAKETSDYDIFLVVEELPSSPFKRTRFVRRPLTGKFEERISIIAKTREEVINNFPSLFLDIGLDGIVLYDKDFMSKRLLRIKEIIKESGLERKKENGEFYWSWKRRPKGKWGIDWEGYHEL